MSYGHDTFGKAGLSAEQRAMQDAKNFGTGFLVNDRYVSLDRVKVFTFPATTAGEDEVERLVTELDPRLNSDSALSWLVCLVQEAQDPEQFLANSKDDPDSYVTMLAGCSSALEVIAIARAALSTTSGFAAGMMWAAEIADAAAKMPLARLSDAAVAIRSAALATTSAAELRDDDGWRDIASAPKDGTRILLWHEKGFAVSGCWYTNDGVDTPECYDPPWSWWSADEDLVMWDSGPDDQPTHWRPLPALPSQGAGS